jgi:hypothetical protein
MASNLDVPVRHIEPSNGREPTAGLKTSDTSDMEGAMKRLTLTGLAMTATLALVACGDVTPIAPAATIQPVDLEPRPAMVQNTRVPFVLNLTNPCNGERVPLVGELHLRTAMTVDQGGGSHVSGGLNGHFTGVGQTTGVRYVSTWAQPVTNNVHPVGTAATDLTIVTNRQVVAQGAAPNFYLKQRIHVTRNANGELTVTRFEFTVACQNSEI